ncbi:tetratricopeptide repeat protein [Halomonas sp. SpR8]|uniref:tetratricopeptide repeat protein n=1 Tax=Halomonas sp. SpR8 TaxID=3050463 RepID=UPI0027E58516|nr:tetratricopeptide repeat protein [Halomonas sp. SpR8]MDQ7729747.1 tetratricopeptide repeat protein [Halomonas sp. SpR8]
MSMRYCIRLPTLLSCSLLVACATTTEQAEESRLLSLADDIAAQGDYATATTLYERAAELSNEDVDINVRLGDARLASGDLQGALRSYRAALEKNIDAPTALLGLGSTQLRLDKVESALRNLRKAAPALDTPTAWSRLGAAQALLGKSETAVSSFSRAADLSPNVPDAQTNLALAQSLAGQHDAAVAQIRDVASSPLAEDRHFHSLILILVLAGDTQLAETIEIPDMPATQRQSLIEQAQQIRVLPDTGEQARAIGLAGY